LQPTQRRVGDPVTKMVRKKEQQTEYNRSRLEEEEEVRAMTEKMGGGGRRGRRLERTGERRWRGRERRHC